MDIEKIQLRLRSKGILIKNDDLAFNLIALNEIVLDRFTNAHRRAGGASAKSNSMNVAAMRSLLLAKGIRISEDDPILICLALNQIVLDEMIEVQRRELSKVKKFLFTVAQPGVISYAKIVVPVLMLSIAGIIFEPDWLRHSLLVAAGCCLGAMLTMLVQDINSRKEAVTVNERSPTDADQRAWSEYEFDQVALKTILSKRTILACKEVLVGGGQPQATVAAKHGISPTQLAMGIMRIENERSSNV